MAVAGRRRIGPYELIEPIGHGGSAVVYRAYDAAHRREVAVKVISGAYASDSTFRARFRQEAELVSRLGHPHILQILDSGETTEAPGAAFPEDVAYLVTEYMPGGNLAGHLGGRRTVRERCLVALTIAQQIGAALDWAHAADVLHRDVKPSNVLVAADGRYVLGDFGLARVVQAGASLHLTASGLVAGTPAYMAPEQALGQPADARTDLYSLGVVLFEVLTGRVPFDAESPMAVMLAHVHQPPPAPSEVAPEVPSAVSSVVVQALAKEREARAESGAQIAALLHAAVASVYGESAITTGTFALLPPDPAPESVAAGVSHALTIRGGSPAAVPADGRFDRGRRRGTLSRGQKGRREAAAARRRVSPPGGWRVPTLVAGFVAGALLVGSGAGAIALGPGRPRVADMLNRYIQDTVPLGVSEALPRESSRNLSLRPSISIRFTQPMDEDSVQAAFFLEAMDSAQAIPVDFQWEGQLLQVVPKEDLAYGTTYRFVVDATARDQDGRELGGILERHFATVAEPPKPVGVVVAAPPPTATAEPTRPAPTAPPPSPPSQPTLVPTRGVPTPRPTPYTPPTLPPSDAEGVHVAGLLMDASGTTTVLEDGGATVPATPPGEVTPAPPATATSAPLPARTVAPPAGSVGPGGTPAGTPTTTTGEATAAAGTAAAGTAWAGLVVASSTPFGGTGTPSGPTATPGHAAAATTTSSAAPGSTSAAGTAVATKTGPATVPPATSPGAQGSATAARGSGTPPAGATPPAGGTPAANGTPGASGTATVPANASVPAGGTTAPSSGTATASPPATGV